MSSALWQRLDIWARSLMPLALTLLLMLVGAVPLHVPHLHSLGPSFAIISVFFWAIYAPSLLRAPAVFAIGLLGDILGGAPLGVGVFVLLVVYGIAISQRRLLATASFAVVWWAFMVVAAGANAGTWLISSIMADAALDPRPVFFSCALGVGLYPALSYLFARSLRSIQPEA